MVGIVTEGDKAAQMMATQLQLKERQRIKRHEHNEREAHDNVRYGSIRRIMLATTAISSGVVRHGRA